MSITSCIQIINMLITSCMQVYKDILRLSRCLQHLIVIRPIEVASVIELSEASGWGRCWFVYDWGVISFCPPGGRDTSLGGRYPSWPVGECRKASDGLPPARRDWGSSGCGRASEAFRHSPTGQEGHLPPREVSLPPGGQNPITPQS